MKRWFRKLLWWKNHRFILSRTVYDSVLCSVTNLLDDPGWISSFSAFKMEVVMSISQQKHRITPAAQVLLRGGIKRLKITGCQVKSFLGCVVAVLHKASTLHISRTQLCSGKEGKQPWFLFGCHMADDALLKAQENDGDNLTPPQKVSHWGVQPLPLPRGNKLRDCQSLSIALNVRVPPASVKTHQAW